MLLIAVALPLWEMVEVPKLRASCTTKDRLRHYWTILGAHLLLAAGSIWMLGWPGVLTGGSTLNAATTALANPWLRVSLLVIALAFAVLALSPFLLSLFKPNTRIAYTKAVAKTPFSFMFPTTETERWTFAALSVSAGFCEEVIFRSFLVAYFAAYGINVFLALAASSLLFGINHGYQGLAGIIKTGVGGFIFGLVFFTTGNLWVAIILHAIVDLSAIYNFRPDLVETRNQEQAIVV